jgi:hypothetical protein
VNVTRLHLEYLKDRSLNRYCSWYVNVLCTARLHGQLTAFADDTALTYDNREPQAVFYMMQKDLRCLRNWFDKHFLILSDITK